MKLKDVVREVRSTHKGDITNIPIVGLEHITPYEITFEKYLMDSESTFTKLFKKGQVLFGRRRAYQHKAAIAHMDGICSGDIMVLEAIPGKIDSNLLPFIIQNDSFFDYAIQHSEGGLSPRVKWSAIANYEFTLPSLDEQKVLADKLWAAYRVKESYKKLLAATDDMLKAKFQEMFGEEEKIKIGDAFTTTSGGTPNSKITHYYSGGTIPWLTSGEVRQGYIHSTESYITEEGLANSSAKWIPESSVVIAMYGATIGNVGITNIPLTTNQAICSILPNNKYDQVFVYYAVKNKTDWMKSQSRGAAQPNISQAIIKQMEIPLPPLPLQQQFVEIANQAEATKESLRKSIENIDQVIKSLINQ